MGVNFSAFRLFSKVAVEQKERMIVGLRELCFFLNVIDFIWNL